MTKFGFLLLSIVIVGSNASINSILQEAAETPVHQYRHKHLSLGEIPLPQRIYDLFEYLKCDLGKVIKCGGAFMKELGYKGSAKDAAAFLRYVGLKYQGKSGFDTLCGAINRMETCYGAGLLDCLNLENLEKMGLDKQNAFMYESFFHIGGYECGPAKEIIDKNFECIENVQKSSQAKTQECLKTFQSQIQQHPDKACQYAQEYDICLAKLFSKCGKAVENVICNMVGKTMELYMPKCKFQCHLLLEDVEVQESVEGGYEYEKESEEYYEKEDYEDK